MARIWYISFVFIFQPTGYSVAVSAQARKWEQEKKNTFLKFFGFSIWDNQTYYALDVAPLHTMLFTTHWYIKSQNISKMAIAFNLEPR